jgi:hypothetical protein
MIWVWDCFGVVQSDDVQPLGRTDARYIIDKNRSYTWFLSLANDAKDEAQIFVRIDIITTSSLCDVLA